MDSPKLIRKTTNRVFFWILVYHLIMVIVNLILSPYSLPEGTDMLISVLVGVAVVYLVNRKHISKDVFVERKKMTAKDFFVLFGCISITQLITAVIVKAAESSGAQGVSFDISKTTFTMLLYSGLVGPLCEELIFRGFVCGSYRKYGAALAIVLSAIAFGLVHANLEQFLAAGLAGLVLAFVCTEYSILWALAYHVINNFLFSDLPYLIFGQGASKTIDAVEYSIFGIFAIYAVYALIKRRGEISAYFSREDVPAQKGAVKEILKSFWLWVFLVIYVGIMVLMMVFPEQISQITAAAAAGA